MSHSETLRYPVHFQMFDNLYIVDLLRFVLRSPATQTSPVFHGCFILNTNSYTTRSNANGPLKEGIFATKKENLAFIIEVLDYIIY